MGLKPGKEVEGESDKSIAEEPREVEVPSPSGKPTKSKRKSGLQRDTPETPVDEKIAGALRYLANDQMSMSTDEPWKQLDGRNRSSTYVGTNVGEFTPEQQDIISDAIMSADARIAVLGNGNTFRSITDVQFRKGKDGGTVIEIQGQAPIDVDLDKLIKSLDEQKAAFSGVKINGQMSGLIPSIQIAIADAAKGYHGAMQEMSSGQSQDAAHREPPPTPRRGIDR